MERLALVRGSREEIIEELEALGKDAARLGKPDKATEFARALRQVQEGDGWVEVRRTVFYTDA